MTLILSGTDGLSDVDGSAATPAIRGTDANTGIFFPAADTIAFSEGGVESMRIDSSGNVGIGTSTLVGYRVAVKQSSNTGLGSVGIASISSTNDTLVGMGYSSATDTCRILASYDSTGAFKPLTFLTSDAERMRIDTSGNVGIGTSSPGQKLEVYNAGGGPTFRVTSADTGTGSGNGFSIGLDNTGAAYLTQNENQPLILLTNATERARLDTSGNLLVGTTSGAFRLNVTAATDCAGFALTNGSMLIREVGSTAANNTMEFHLRPNSGKSAYITFTENAIDDRWSVGIQNGNANLRFVTGVGGSGTERMNLSSGGNLTISGATATKASGTTWANPSDQRLKDNIRDYAKGTTELMQVRVREWEYNGKGGTTEGMKGLGVIADEVMTVLPDTVENYDAKLNADDEETTAIKKFDATEITWLLVKTVQEQQALITTLTDRITALETPTGTQA